MNKYDFGYEVLGLGNDHYALMSFLTLIDAWRKVRTIESCESLGYVVGSLARRAYPSWGSPLSLMIVQDEAQMTPEHLAYKHLHNFLDELPLSSEHLGNAENAPASQAFIRGWMSGNLQELEA